MISTTLGDRALWTVDGGPPRAGPRLADVANSRWRRACAHVASEALRGAGPLPGTAVLATTAFAGGESVTDAFEELMDRLGIPVRVVVSAGEDTVAMGLFEAASLGSRSHGSLLMVVELTPAAELAFAARVADPRNGVALTLRRMDDIEVRPSSSPIAGPLADNPCRGVLSLFETPLRGSARLDPRECGRYEAHFREAGGA